MLSCLYAIISDGKVSQDAQSAAKNCSVALVDIGILAQGQYAGTTAHGIYEPSGISKALHIPNAAFLHVSVINVLVGNLYGWISLVGEPEPEPVPR